MPFMFWRICAIVTEQSHVLKFCIFISKVMSGFCVLVNGPLAVIILQLLYRRALLWQDVVLLITGIFLLILSLAL